MDRVITSRMAEDHEVLFIPQGALDDVSHIVFPHGTPRWLVRRVKKKLLKYERGYRALAKDYVSLVQLAESVKTRKDGPDVEDSFS